MARYQLMQCQSKRHKDKGKTAYQPVKPTDLFYECVWCKKLHEVKDGLVKEKNNG